MKKILLILIVILIEMLILLIPETYATYNVKYIYIDPGHGGFDGGAVNNNLLEKDVVLKVAYYLKDYFEYSGYNVLMTRYNDTALANTKKEDIYKRVDLINKKNVLLYISIHANYYPSSNVSGAQVFYKNKDSNKELSETIQEYLKIVDNNKRFAKEINGKYLLDHLDKTGCLVEVGFLSSDIDYSNLLKEEYLDKVAKYIYLGVVDYLNKQGE